MNILYYGHACFKLKSKRVSIVTDPYDPAKVGFKLPQLEADIVTISHDHQDHNFQKKVATPQGKQLFPITGPGEYEIANCSIFGYPAWHDQQQGAQRGANIIYVIEMDQVRIAHLGDLGHQIDDHLLEEIGDIDVLLIPVGGTYTLDGPQAAELTKKISPRIVVPMHYQLPGLNPETFSKLTDEKPFLSQLGVKVREDSKLSIKKSDLPEEMEAVVLKPKV